MTNVLKGAPRRGAVRHGPERRGVAKPELSPQMRGSIKSAANTHQKAITLPCGYVYANGKVTRE
jgi:hypothetical protein